MFHQSWGECCFFCRRRAHSWHFAALLARDLNPGSCPSFWSCRGHVLKVELWPCQGHVEKPSELQEAGFICWIGFLFTGELLFRANPSQCAPKNLIDSLRKRVRSLWEPLLAGLIFSSNRRVGCIHFEGYNMFAGVAWRVMFNARRLAKSAQPARIARSTAYTCSTGNHPLACSWKCGKIFRLRMVRALIWHFQQWVEPRGKVKCVVIKFSTSGFSIWWDLWAHGHTLAQGLGPAACRSTACLRPNFCRGSFPFVGKTSHAIICVKHRFPSYSRCCLSAWQCGKMFGRAAFL